MPFMAYYLTPQGEMQKNLGEEQVRVVLKSRKGLLWVDIHEPDEKDGKFLREVFGFHARAVDACVSKVTNPPGIDWLIQDYLFIIFHGIDYTATRNLVRTKELAVFLAEHYVVTNHNFHMHSVDYVQELVLPDGGPMQKGANSLVHALLDALTHNIITQVDTMTTALAEFDDEVMQHPNRSTLHIVKRVKRSVTHLHRVMAPQRELVYRLSQENLSPLIESDAHDYYRDIYQRILLIESQTRDLRDLTDSAMDSVSIRQEETMKTLTIWATILLPLTLLVGLFGMNVDVPWEDSALGFVVLMGIMGIYTATALVWWLSSRGRNIIQGLTLVSPTRQRRQRRDAECVLRVDDSKLRKARPTDGGKA